MRSRRYPVLLLAALLASLACAGAAGAASPWPRPERYDVALRLDHATQTLTGTERIRFANDSPAAIGSIWLRLWPNGYGSCGHRWAHVAVIAGGRLDGAATGCTAARVRLPAALAPGGRGSIALRLRVQAPPGPNRFGQEDGVGYFGNALPLLDVESAAGPDLDPYTDLGDPFYSLDARWSVTLDLRSSLTAATTGSVIARRSLGHGMKRLRIRAPHARDFAIVAGPLAVDTSRTAGGIRLHRYQLRTSPRADSLHTLALARAAVERFSSWYGNPGEREIDIVAGPSSLGSFGSGMEFPGLVLASDEPRLVAHELAHQWWYSLVGDDQWRSPWLDESFAEYAARRLPDATFGADGLDCDPADPVAPFGSAPLTAGMSHWDAAGGDDYYRTVYLGGTCALRSLEHDWGAAATTAFLRSYATAHRFGVTSTADFVAALRSAAPPGYDVDTYLRRARIEFP